MHTWPGGSIRSLADNTSISDYDIFFKDEKSYEDFADHVESLRHKLVSKNSLDTLRTYIVKGLKLQVIGFRNSPTMYDLLLTFDFTCTRFGYDGRFIYFDRDAYQDAKAKRLRIFKIQKIIPMIKRSLKYANKGYTILDDTANRLFNELEERHPEISQADYDAK